MMNHLSSATSSANCLYSTGGAACMPHCERGVVIFCFFLAEAKSSRPCSVWSGQAKRNLPTVDLGTSLQSLPYGFAQTFR